MVSRELEEKLKELNTEDFIWIIYIFIIIMSWYSNSLERKYFINKDEKSKSDYRCIIVLIFTILIVVYLYFLKSSWSDLKKYNKTGTSREKDLAFLSFLASLLIVISGTIFLYIALVDDNLNIELAFN